MLLHNPIMMYAVVTYANMRGVRAVDRIVELCERDLAFIWLTKGQKPKRDAFYEFKNKKLTADVLDELNGAFIICSAAFCRLNKVSSDNIKRMTTYFSGVIMNKRDKFQEYALLMCRFFTIWGW